MTLYDLEPGVLLEHEGLDADQLADARDRYAATDGKAARTREREHRAIADDLGATIPEPAEPRRDGINVVVDLAQLDQALAGDRDAIAGLLPAYPDETLDRLLEAARSAKPE